MNEFRTIPELQEEIRKICQAFDNDDITGTQFEAAAADLNQRIKALKLEKAKQKKRDEIQALKIAGKIPGLVYALLLIQISNAETVSKVNAINNFY